VVGCRSRNSLAQLCEVRDERVLPRVESLLDRTVMGSSITTRSIDFLEMSNLLL
jgi:hypothetical protein